MDWLERGDVVLVLHGEFKQWPCLANMTGRLAGYDHICLSLLVREHPPVVQLL